MDEIKITSVDGGAINEAEYNRCPECLTGFADMPCFGRRGMGDREDSDADDADDADDDVVLCLYHRYQIGVQEGSNGQTNVPRTSVSEGSIRHYDARSRLLPSPFMGRYSWYTASQPRDHLSRRLASTGQAVPVCIPLMMSFSRTGGEFFKVLPDLQPIPSCWERPRRLPRRASGHLHLEREFLICFTPPRHLGKGGGGGGRVWERAEESNPHHSGRPISPTAPKRLPSQLVAPSLPPFHIRICICSPGNQNTLSSLPAANPC